MTEQISLLHGDCYELIKQIPDKSIDLIYTDIPYQYESGVASDSPLSKRISKEHNEVLLALRQGIDYKIFDEFIRVLKHIYIYMV